MIISTPNYNLKKRHAQRAWLNWDCEGYIWSDFEIKNYTILFYYPFAAFIVFLLWHYIDPQHSKKKKKKKKSAEQPVWIIMFQGLICSL